jgi:hypothetical protein
VEKGLHSVDVIAKKKAVSDLRWFKTALALSIVMLSVIAITFSAPSVTASQSNQSQPQNQLINTTSPTTFQIMLMVTWLVFMIAFAVIGIFKIKFSVMTGFIWMTGGVFIFTPMQTVLGMLVIAVGGIFALTGALAFAKGR